VYEKYETSVSDRGHVFLSRDPAQADENLYRYCEDNPANATDPTGLWSANEVGCILADYAPETVDFLSTKGVKIERVDGIRVTTQKLNDEGKWIESPKGGSRVDGWTSQDGKTIYLAGTTMNDFQMAGLIVHEAAHAQFGPSEVGAYTNQIQFLNKVMQSYDAGEATMPDELKKAVEVFGQQGSLPFAKITYGKDRVPKSIEELKPNQLGPAIEQSRSFYDVNMRVIGLTISHHRVDITKWILPKKKGA
jgi:hypothetical protein